MRNLFPRSNKHLGREGRKGVGIVVPNIVENSFAIAKSKMYFCTTKNLAYYHYAVIGQKDASKLGIFKRNGNDVLMVEKEQKNFKKRKGRNPKEETELLDCKVQSRLSKAELEQVNTFLSTAANVNNMSDLIRRLLTRKPIIVYTRDKSLDETITEIIKIRKELNRIGTNFNQTVKVINTFKNLGYLNKEVDGILKTIEDVDELNRSLLSLFDKIGKKWL